MADVVENNVEETENQNEGANPEEKVPGEKVPEEKGNAGTPKESFSKSDVEKMIEDAKATIKSEYDEKEKLRDMKDDERKQYEEEQRTKSLEERETKLFLKELEGTAKELLAEDNLPSKAVPFVMGKDLEETKAKIEQFKEMYSTSLAADVNERVKGKGQTLDSGSKGGTVEDERDAIRQSVKGGVR